MWWRFARWLAGTALLVLAVVYAFVVVVDPWGMLPLSPRLPRVPISTNARFSMPALARSPAFDSAVLGTSTTRLLRPDRLDALFGARFVNLSMNAATAWEQSRLLDVFLRAHPAPRALIIDIDESWCTPSPQRTTGRPFPDWMYQPSTWRGYREMLNLYAIQEAANQFAVMVGLKRRRYGLDGYTSFVPDDSAYDPARVDAAFARWPMPDDSLAVPGEAFDLPALLLLSHAMAALPPGTRVVLFLPPYEVELQGSPGSRVNAQWTACKAAVRTIARDRHAAVLDEFRPSAITSDRANYWDPVHFRVAIADAMMVRLAQASPEN